MIRPIRADQLAETVKIGDIVLGLARTILYEQRKYRQNLAAEDNSVVEKKSAEYELLLEKAIEMAMQFLRSLRFPYRD
uniref:Uncharacterized protein n=1 Tax=Panagrolaimus superbus TaxID=310955 RepID=A0A914YHW9_9BILA